MRCIRSTQPLDGGVLKRAWLQYYERPILPSDLQFYDVYMGVDLAITKKDTADYTCTCVIASRGLLTLCIYLIGLVTI